MKFVEGFLGDGAREQKGIGRGPMFCTLNPLEAGKQFVNRLLFFPFRPSRLPIFNMVDPELYTLRVPLQLHYLLYEDINGEIQRATYLCKREMTKLFIANFGNGEYFGQDCSLCQQSDKLYEKYNERRKQVGLYKVKMDKDEYLKRVKADEVLNHIYNEQRRFKPILRYLYLVFDLSKYLGEKEAMDEAMGVEFLMAGKQIKDGLQAQILAGHKFWDLNEGLKVVRITKDTTEGYTTSGILRSSYSVAIEPKSYELPQELKQYFASGPFVEGDFIPFWDDDISLDNLVKVDKEIEQAGEREQQEIKRPLIAQPQEDIKRDHEKVPEIPKVMTKGTDGIVPPGSSISKGVDIKTVPISPLKEQGNEMEPKKTGSPTKRIRF